MRDRRKSREMALQVLYAYEACDGSSTVDDLIEYTAGENGSDDEVKKYCSFLVEHAIASMGEVDELLQRHTANWDLKRVSAVDRTILRLSVAELQYSPNIPYKVVIDEAVEIAKRFGTDDSGRFVNGVIDSTYRELSGK